MPGRGMARELSIHTNRGGQQPQQVATSHLVTHKASLLPTLTEKWISSPCTEMGREEGLPLGNHTQGEAAWGTESSGSQPSPGPDHASPPGSSASSHEEVLSSEPLLPKAPHLPARSGTDRVLIYLLDENKKA